ncbi:MAG: ABC transporter ATP-binding protein [Opitutales bacterium]|nr:ABC transporter ATP-binding protein [Opitutales bacterium]
MPETLLAFLWANRKRFRGGIFFAFLRILTIAPLPLIFQRIIDDKMPAGNISAILWLSLLTIGLIVSHQYLSVEGATRLGKGVTNAVLGLRARVFEKIQFLSFGYLDQQKAGRLLSKYAFDSQKVEGVMMPILNGFLPNIFYSVVTFIILVSLNWQLALVIFFALPVFAIMRGRYFARLRQRNEASRIAYEKLTGTASEYLGALRLVRVYGEEEQAQTRLKDRNEEVLHSRVKLITVSSSFSAFSFGAIQLLSLVVIAGGAILAIYGQISTGVVVAFVAGVPALVTPIQMFANIVEQFFLGRESYRSITELLETTYVEEWKGTRTVSPLEGKIEFEKVSFRYSAADSDALEDFSVSIRAGEKVALVGPSGAGKSTVANLVMGLYKPDQGVIRIDGVPQAELDMRWLRRNTAIVMQENILLSGTVAENLRFARLEATDEEVREAARLAQAEEFIDRLPHGFQTLIGERGATLSGGQRQRLAIARAILRNPAILILDEPTSALDYESEHLIQKALDNLSRGRTVVTIAHRLSTIRNADRILVLNHGRLVEQGSYDELASGDGYFGQVLAAQNTGGAQE